MSFKIRFPIAYIPASYSNIKKDGCLNKEVDIGATGSLKQTIIDTDRKSDIKINSIINSTTVINCTSGDVGENKKIKSPYTDRDSKNIFFKEKNLTIVNFPLQDFKICADSNERYELVANVVHVGTAQTGFYKVQVCHLV